VLSIRGLTFFAEARRRESQSAIKGLKNSLPHVGIAQETVAELCVFLA